MTLNCLILTGKMLPIVSRFKIMELQYNADWQTKARGSNDSEYQLYLELADNGEGLDITTGKPLKTYDEWINS